MKRPDQHRIDVGEAGASDYKNRPGKPEDADRDVELYSRVMKGRDVKGQPIPPDSLEPETERARAAEMEREQDVRARQASDQADETTESGEDGEQEHTRRTRHAGDAGHGRGTEGADEG